MTAQYYTPRQLQPYGLPPQQQRQMPALQPAPAQSYYLTPPPTPPQPYQQMQPQFQTSIRPPVSPQYLCLHAGCPNTGFTRYADLQRHVQIVHDTGLLRRVDCDVPNCQRKGDFGFTRKDKAVDHMREVHKLNLPKRVSGGKRSVS